MNGNYQAKCSVCGIKGKGEKDFICENCGDPEKNFFHCGRCGNVREFSEDELIKFMKDFDIILPPGPGIVIKSSYCDKCLKQSDKGLHIDFWKVRP